MKTSSNRDVKFIYWFAYFNPEEPSVRYRAIYPLKQLKEEFGIDSLLVYPGYDAKSIFKFARAYLEVLLFRRKNSVVVYQKLFTDGFYTKALKVLLKVRRKDTIYDTDDAEHTRRPANTIEHFVKNTSHCSVGSGSLADYVSSLGSRSFPLTSPVIRHNLKIEKRRKPLTIGWIGYYSAHRRNLIDLFFPAIIQCGLPLRLKLLGVRTEAELKELHDFFGANPHIEIEAPLKIDWMDEMLVYQHILDFDIGVAPLHDNEFNRAKSAFKLKQCLSCGVPVLASPVGENIPFIEHGKNGFFCDTIQEYSHAIQLIHDMSDGDFDQLRLHALATLEKFSMDHYCQQFLRHAMIATG